LTDSFFTGATGNEWVSNLAFLFWLRLTHRAASPRRTRLPKERTPNRQRKISDGTFRPSDGMVKASQGRTTTHANAVARGGNQWPGAPQSLSRSALVSRLTAICRLSSSRNWDYHTSRWQTVAAVYWRGLFMPPVVRWTRKIAEFAPLTRPKPLPQQLRRSC